MKARNKMQTAVITFLAIAVVILTIGMTIITKLYVTLCNQYEESGNCIDELIADNKVLLEDKRDLIRQNDELLSDNQQLKAAVKEMREMIKAHTTPAESSEPEPAEEVNPLLPPQSIPTNTYRCEPYMVIDWEKSDDIETVYKSAFSKNSEQAALQEDCFTDLETGIRYYFDTSDWTKWYCAALAGAYGIEVGHCYIFTLANGTELPVMLADFKHDISDPKPDDYGDDDVNYDSEKCLNVIELVVDMPAVPKAAREAGTMSALDKFGGLYGHGGNIVDAKDAGRRWKA